MKLVLKNVRLSFNDLFVATQINGAGDAKFRSTFLVEKNTLIAKDIEAAVKKVAADKWGAKAEALLTSIRGNPNRFNVQDGDLSDYDGYPGNLVVKANSTVKPIVIDRNRHAVDPQSGMIYSGCYVNAIITFFAYDSQGNKGISASLGGVQFVRDGDAFGGGRPASTDEFEDLSVSEGVDADFA